MGITLNPTEVRKFLLLTTVNVSAIGEDYRTGIQY
jgi:hypothetical protein